MENVNNRIQKTFQNHKAFIPFITVGDPDIDTTKDVVRAAVAAGADLIELGIPFSDPTAEGPVIMEADIRALKAGTTTEKVFQLTKELRQEFPEVALVYMTYANVVYHYGIQHFSERASDAGIDGLILPDVPLEERGEFDGILSQYGIDLISMVAPTSENRIAEIVKNAKGFIYIVSSLGVTGTRSAITTDIGKLVGVIRENSSIPCAVGFGISNPEQAAKMAALSDGAIVGSAVMKLIAANGKKAAEPVGAFIREMAEAVHQA